MATATRDQTVLATRTRIAEAALSLFVDQGYAKTTVDQIAAAAGVGRRTVFRHFPTKEAILFDQLAVRREVAVQHLHERPASEPPLVSLHVVLRELCVQGYDRGFLTQIRAVLATEPQLAGEQLSGGIRAFEKNVRDTLAAREGGRASLFELHALTQMACGWFVTAAQLFLVEHRDSLVECFDEVVAICRASAAQLR
ncbi:MAG TPA: helix-turn-helix domain-containing protein [Acidimicrobiia bacterium]